MILKHKSSNDDYCFAGSSMPVLRLVARVSWTRVFRSTSSSVGIKKSVGILWHIVEASLFTSAFDILLLVVLVL